MNPIHPRANDEPQMLKAVVLDDVDVLEQGVAPVVSIESASTPNCPPANGPNDTCP